MVKVGVIGLGVGKHHLQGYSRIPQAKIWAVADMNEERLKEFSRQYSVPRSFQDYRELLRLKEIDAVSVALPNYLHCPVTVEALESGKHVLVEKPMARNSEEAGKMVKTATKTKKILMVGMNYHYFPEIQVLKRMVDQGELGDIYYIKAVFLRKSSFAKDTLSWFRNKEMSGGGSLIDLGPHMIDLSLWLADDFDAISVYGVTYSKFLPVDDFVSALLRLRKGTTVDIEISWEAFTRPHLSLTLLGTKAGATTNPLKLYKDIGDTPVEITPEIKEEDYFTCSMERQIVHFLECINKKTEPITSAEKGLKVMRILDAIYESAKTEKEVKMV